MPNWIRDSRGRLVKLETPHNKELELGLNIMEATPEDQHSHHGHQDNPNAFRSMRDRMYPPRMSAHHDKAKIWLNSLRPRSIRTWTDFYDKKIGGARTEKMHEVQAVAETPVQVKPCPICQSYEHLVEECPTIPAAREMFGDQANVIGQFKPNNNASYGNTYNSSWRNIQISHGSQEHLSIQQPAQPSQQASNLEQAIVNLARLTNLNTVQEKGRFPSQPHQNPKGIHEVETHEENLHRGLNVNKKAFLTEQVSAIIQCKSPLKYKDPGSYHFSHDWRKVVEKALLDLGASVNLLPYSVYKQLGLGELKPTSITLSLADRSVKIPRGIIEDVLVQVDNFYYPVDLLFLIRPNCQGN
ncbi:hypothetical protein CK203_116217 [Vitis vinifera]|uniref:Uncharacterized protein n=1 Tax=Vitis vinifera TaxID=29760 RepID=A0A438CD18_VITVI|nr:hypothetical protein CK203_116217 [Vitis vinifera]